MGVSMGAVGKIGHLCRFYRRSQDSVEALVNDPSRARSYRLSLFYPGKSAEW